ncbi:MAG: restriction endonuclease subunit S [Thermoplasmata archaeon]
MNDDEFKDTEIGRIPKEWEIKKLSQLIEYKKGKTPKKVIKEYKEKCLPYLSTEYLRENKITTFVEEHQNVVLVNDDDIILLWDGSNAGEFFLGKQGILSSTMVKIDLKENNNKKFLFYILKMNEDYFKRNTKGTGIPHVDKNILLDFTIPLPPLEEQQKIAYVLSKIQKAIELQDRLIKLLQELKKTMMHKLFTEGIGHTEFKDTEIGRIPKEWEIKKLLEIAELQRGLSYSGKEKSVNEILEGYLFLTLNSIKEGGGLKEDGWTWIKSDRLKERHFVREGDIVIANTDIGMQRGHILGAPAIVHFPEWYKKDKVVFSMDLSKLLLRISNIDVNFLFYYLSFVQPLARKYHTGTNVWHMNLDSWAKDLLIPFPPLEEQKKISNILLTIDNKISLEENRKDLLEKLFKTMLNKLMTGQIRVKDLNVEVFGV